MDTERISWRGLIWREAGSLSPTFFFFHLSPFGDQSAQIKCPDVWCWQGAGSGPCPSQSPAMVFKESQEVAGEGWSFLAGPIPTGPSSFSATPSSAISHGCIPGVVSVTGGCPQEEEGTVMDTCARRMPHQCGGRAEQLMAPCPQQAPLSRLVIALGWLNPALRPGIDRWMLASQQSISYSSTRLPASRCRSLFCEWHGLTEAVCACLATLRN